MTPQGTDEEWTSMQYVENIHTYILIIYIYILLYILIIYNYVKISRMYIFAYAPPKEEM